MPTLTLSSVISKYYLETSVVFAAVPSGENLQYIVSKPAKHPHLRALQFFGFNL